VPPEGVGRLGCPPRQVFAEGCLLAQGLTRLDLTGLIPLDLAVQSPHHHPADPCRSCLQNDQIADARLIFPPAVVDDQDVTMGGAAERFQEHINAAAAPIPGGATRSGTPARIQASATSGVERPPNSVSIPARPSSLPVTLPDATRIRINHLERWSSPAICGRPQIFAAPHSDSGGSLPSDLGSNTDASSPVSHASRTALRPAAGSGRVAGASVS
jgi:hypothetical protein